MLAQSPHTITDPAPMTGKSAKCWLDKPHSFQLMGPDGAAPQIVADEVATIQTSAYPELKVEDSLQLTNDETAEVTDYAIRRRELVDDGALTHLWLRRQ